MADKIRGDLAQELSPPDLCSSASMGSNLELWQNHPLLNLDPYSY